MSITDLYSKRQKKLRGEEPDIYLYDQIPKKVRVQIALIIKEAVGEYQNSNKDVNLIYVIICKTLCKEYGRFNLVNGYRITHKEEIIDFLLKTKNTEEVLDVVELFFKYINNYIRNNSDDYQNEFKAYTSPDEAINELNERFKENGIGYSFEEEQIIRVDSKYTHAEIIKPVISLLSNKVFEGANEEYLKAHEHYRHGRNKECLTECNKAFESTLKTICKEKGWSFNKKDTANKLIKVCFDKELVPSFTQTQFNSLISLLESGIPTIRNNLGAHGQGPTPQTVDDEMTRYGLNLTGSNIIFLVEQSGIK